MSVSYRSNDDQAGAIPVDTVIKTTSTTDGQVQHIIMDSGSSVSVSSSALPSGAATAANQTNGDQKAQIVQTVTAAVAMVAAIAMVVLNTILFSQRQDEFGILHAVGRSRRWLVLRVVRETASVAAVAWLIGAAVSLALIIGVQAKVYAPLGVQRDWFNLERWLFTLPIPLAVIATSAGTIARMLAKLDPVAIIERR